VWSSITGPPIKTGQYNDTPSYGIMVWSTAEPTMARFKLNMSSIPVPGVPLATINWAMSPPNDVDTTFTATAWTEPPVLFYAPPLDSSPRCNTIQFIVSAWIDTPGYVGKPPVPSTDPTKINKMMIWGAQIASAPENPIVDEVCMDSPITGLPMVQCSRFRAKGAGGDACREWAISRKVVGVNTAPDKAYEAYCNSNSKNGDCDCLKRSQAVGSTNEAIRDRYNAVQIPVPDTCWFGPCKDNDGNYSVVTESILNPNPAVKTCPDDVCIQVVEAWAKRDASIDNVKMEMNCAKEYTDYLDNKYACDNCAVAQPAPSDKAPKVKKGYPSTQQCVSGCAGGGGGGGGLSAGAIAGISVACVVVVIAIILAIALRKPKS